MNDIINTYNAERRGILNLIISSPFIYGMIVPLAILHFCAQVYQQIAFPLYGLETVDSRKYIKDVRRYLPYLSTMEKLNCVYCSYGNGVLAFAQAVAKQTEKMWCPIKNARSRMEQDLPHRKEFAEYGDPESLQEHLAQSNHVQDRSQERSNEGRENNTAV